MNTDSKSPWGEGDGTVYVEEMTAAALRALAAKTGRTAEEVFREHLGVPSGPLVVKVVDLDEAIRGQLRQAAPGSNIPWSEVLKRAFAVATTSFEGEAP